MSRGFLIVCGALLSASAGRAKPASVVLDMPTKTIDVSDYVEYEARVDRPDAKNPFADATLTAEVTSPGGKVTTAAGFCDAADGTRYRVRVMPTEPGKHTVKATFAQNGFVVSSTTVFAANPGKRAGLLRVDPARPYHFQYANTGEHFFWNGTTAYWLLGVQDDTEIKRTIGRLADLKVNRIRVALNARTSGGERWYEPAVKNSDAFRFRIDPWVAGNPDDFKNPQFDTSRFNLPVWEKLDHLVLAARGRGVQVSVIFHLDGQDPGVDPFGGGKKYPGSEAEWRYYRYAAARLAAFDNVMWDITNEWHLFRDEAWVNKAAAVLREADPYQHLMSVHGKGTFPFRKEPWADFALYQSWDEGGGYKFMRKNRDEQAKLGRPIPQVNEEYGYEDHYPGPWGGGRKTPARSADNRRRLAWEMSIAGGYQTTGERADVPGQGGWLTGRGDDSMVMLKGYAHMVGFFTAFDWWTCDPVDGLADHGAMALASGDKKVIAVYLPKGGSATVKLGDTAYSARGYDPRTGSWKEPIPATGEWRVEAPTADDWAVLLVRR